MIRAVGFALVALAGIGAVVLVTNAEWYAPGAPLSYNLREGHAFTIWRTIEAEPVVIEGGADSPFDRFRSEMSLTPPPQREIAFRLSFGNAAAALLAVGVLGVGLVVFGPRALREP